MKRGFTLIELMVYLSILVAVFIMFTESLQAISRSYGRLRMVRDLDVAAITFFDRATREIRNASSIDSASSMFATSPGILAVSKVDSDGSTTRTKFSVVDSSLHIFQNDIDLGSLFSGGVIVNSVVFYMISTERSKAARIELEIEQRRGAVNRRAKYYSTIILRGSYQ